MEFLMIIIGLSLFEIITSIDNAVINAEVVKTMQPKGRRWFVTWGLFFSVFLVRGLLPLGILVLMIPGLDLTNILSIGFSDSEVIEKSVEATAPLVLIGGGVFMILLFFYWLFLEEKHFGLPRFEKFFIKQGLWFYTVTSIILATLIWFAIKVNPIMAFSAAAGSVVFFITNGFKHYAEHKEKDLKSSTKSDLNKIIYLEIIDATFSIDGVIGAFAFTFSIPLILLGNGIGSVLVRQITMANVEKVSQYIYLKNGAMYSILILGIFMILESFKIHIPTWASPLATVIIILFFFLKSQKHIKLSAI